MDEKYKISLINNFLDYAQADLKSYLLSNVKKYSGILFQYLGHSSPDMIYRGSNLNTDFDPGRIVRFKEPDYYKIQKEWKTSLDILFNQIESGTPRIDFNVPSFFGDNEGFFYGPQPGFELNKLNAKINKKKILFPPGFITFLRALSGYPVESLKRCPNCNKIFFAPTNLRKKYCSLRCQKSASVKRSRAKKKPSK